MRRGAPGRRITHQPVTLRTRIPSPTRPTANIQAVTRSSDDSFSGSCSSLYIMVTVTPLYGHVTGSTARDAVSRSGSTLFSVLSP